MTPLTPEERMGQDEAEGVGVLDDIRRWIKRAPEGTTHMIVVCDTFSYEDFPIFVSNDVDFWKEYDAHNGPNMSRIMEVYDLRMDHESQITAHRAFNMPKERRHG